MQCIEETANDGFAIDIEALAPSLARHVRLALHGDRMLFRFSGKLEILNYKFRTRRTIFRRCSTLMSRGDMRRRQNVMDGGRTYKFQFGLVAVKHLPDQ